MSSKLIATDIQMADAAELLKFTTAYLWSEPGTGKTMTMLMAIKMGGIKKGVIIAPPTALGMWQEELRTQLGMTGAIISRAQKFYTDERKEVLKQADFLISSYGLAVTNHRILAEFLSSQDEDTPTVCIIDEAHYCKTAGAKRTMSVIGEKPRLPVRNIRSMPPVTEKDADLTRGIAHFADMTWMATGTPRTRWADDLWAQLYYGRKAILKHHGALTYSAFVTKFCFMKQIRLPNGSYREAIGGDKNITMMNALLRDCQIIRRTLSEVAKDLPPLTTRTVKVHSKIAAFKKMEEAEILMGLRDKKSEVSETFRLIGIEKITQATEFIIDNWGGPTLVGFWHTSVGQALTTLLREDKRNLVVVMADGSTDGPERDRIRQRFNEGKIDVLVGQMEALSTSMNLQEIAKHVVMAEQIPSPGTWQQFYQRVYRKGQTGHVQLDEILSDHPIDQAIRKIRMTKAASNERTIGQLGERA